MAKYAVQQIQLRMAMLRVVGDTAAILASFWLAYWIRFRSGWLPVEPESWLPRYYALSFNIATALLILHLAVLGQYRHPPGRPFASEWFRGVRTLVIGWVLLLALTFYVQPEVPFSRALPPIALALMSALVGVSRGGVRVVENRLLARLPEGVRVLLIGCGAGGPRLAHGLNSNPRLGYSVVGYLTEDGLPRQEMPERLPLLGGIGDLEHCLDEHAVDEVVVAELPQDRSILAGVIMLCERNMVLFKMVPDLFDILTSSVEITGVDGVPLIGLPENPLDRPWNRLLKRAEDLVIGSMLLILTAPLLILAACWIRLDSKGPIFYKQLRCGRGGEPFQFFKLRTMRQGAELESGPVWAVPDDPRCTYPGKWLRRLNIDELPQLINVLRGEMSLVGPRPERPFFVEQFRCDLLRYMSRHRATPGMTGWAQVNGLRGQTSIEERLKYDLYYLEHWSLLFDLKILLLTILAHKNAY